MVDPAVHADVTTDWASSAEPPAESSSTPSLGLRQVYKRWSTVQQQCPTPASSLRTRTMGMSQSLPDDKRVTRVLKRAADDGTTLMGVATPPSAKPRRKRAPRNCGNKDPNMPKRPIGAFLCYAQIQRPYLFSSIPGMTIGEAMRRLGESWRQISAAERVPYFQMHEERKADYETAMAIYRSETPAEQWAAQGEVESEAPPPRPSYVEGEDEQRYQMQEQVIEEEGERAVD